MCERRRAEGEEIVCLDEEESDGGWKKDSREKRSVTRREGVKRCHGRLGVTGAVIY